MNEDQLPGKPLSEWANFFSEPGFDQTLLEQRFLFQPGYAPPLRLALWLDYFLIAGEAPLKKKWGQLSLEDQNALGIELLKCYLFQPLFLRLSPGGKSALKNPGGLLGKSGKLLFYPLAHDRLWPGLLTVLKEELFSSEEVFKGLQPGLMMTSSSRLEAIRRRAETLGSFFLTGQRTGLAATEPANPGKSALQPIEDDPTQVPLVVNSESTLEPTQPLPADPDIFPASSASPKKKKKSKPATDQLKLF